MSLVRTVCPHDCPDRCSVVVSVNERGRITHVGGDPDHLQTDGFLCGKVTRYSKRVYADTRILHPLKRVGPKGCGTFERVSWKDALELIAENVREAAKSQGATSIAHYQGTGSLGVLAENAFPSLVHHLGGTVQIGSICGGESAKGWQAGAGLVGGSDPLRILQSDLVVIWGCNAAVSNMHLFGLVKKARARGARLIVIDPYATLTARKADFFVKPFPGTDGALAMGLMRLLMEEGAWNRSFLTAHADHVDKLEALCRTGYDIASVSRATRVPEADIRRLAKEFGATANIFIRAGIGMTRHAFGGHALWAIAGLGTVRGVFAEPGGGVLAMTHADPDYVTKDLFSPKKSLRTCNVNSLGRTLTALKDPPVKVLFVACGNPMATSPEQGVVATGLGRDDLFTVVHEQFMTDTAAMADVVLPATTFLECDDLHGSYGSYDFHRQNGVIPPEGESVSTYECARRIAHTLQLQGSYFDKTEEEALQSVFHASGFPWTYEELKDGRAHRLPHIPEPTAEGFGKNGFGGRFQFWRPDFAEAGLPPSPGQYEGTWGISALGADQFHLMSPPTMDILNSSFAELGDGQRSGSGVHDLVLMSPEDATRLQLADGAETEIYNEHGSIRRIVRITDAVQRQLLVVEGVFWARHLGDKGGVNRLTSGRVAAMSGIPTYHEVLVRVR